MKMGPQAYLAELIGTFALVFFGTVSITVFVAILGLSSPAGSVIGIALTFGIILMSMVYVLGPISGCHVNPAVTITAVALRKMEVDDGVLYIVAQVVGAVLAVGAHVVILPEAGAMTEFGATLPGVPIGRSDMVALVVELIITFFLMLSYAVAYTDKASNGISGLVIGMTLVGLTIVAWPLTGASANPARSIGPAIWSGAYQSLWVYIVGPIVGALLAGFAYQYLLTPRKTKR
ncbi:MAG: aquaporin [Candidatus Bathyarchaeia archaeon]|jgi:aquaporin-4